MNKQHCLKVKYEFVFFGSFSDTDIWKLGFDLRNGLNEECCGNGIVEIIRDNVLQIGRNLHMLRLLGNLSLLNDVKGKVY